MEKTRLLGKTPSELKEIALAAGLPGFTGKQIAQWIYGKRVRTITEMTNLIDANRAYEANATVFNASKSMAQTGLGLAGSK